ncbi:MAG: hypothetical protein ACREDY_00890 [Bradyrhizobium sp.]
MGGVVTAATIPLDSPNKQLSWLGGSLLGQGITDTIGFYGLTVPVAQRAAGNNTALTASSTTTVQLAVLTEIQTTLVDLGLMPSS